jgi:hypothetical protein
MKMSSTEIARFRVAGGATHMTMFVLLALGLLGCYSRKNHLSFPSGSAAVADSIEVMCHAMNSLRANNGGFANYVVSWNGEFCIGHNAEFASVEAAKQCVAPPMQGMTNVQWVRFMDLVEFLNKNGLSTCWWDFMAVSWSFNYLEDPDASGSEERDVVYVPNDAVRKNVLKYCDVFQEEGQLMLIHHRRPARTFYN